MLSNTYISWLQVAEGISVKLYSATSAKLMFRAQNETVQLSLYFLSDVDTHNQEVRYLSIIFKDTMSFYLCLLYLSLYQIACPLDYPHICAYCYIGGPVSWN